MIGDIKGTPAPHTRHTNFSILNSAQCLLMFYTLSSFPANFSLLLQLSPLGFGIIYMFLSGSFGRGFIIVGLLWTFGEFALYYNFTSDYFRLADGFTWIFMPGIEAFFVMWVCLVVAASTSGIFQTSINRKMGFENKYRIFYSCRRDFEVITSILFIFGLLVVFESILNMMHGYSPYLNSVIFFIAYLCMVAMIAGIRNIEKIHKCREGKLLSLNFSSILASVYILRYLLDF